MAWPNKVYVATAILGVYYTADFAVDIGQPIWTAVNGGLPSTALRAFAVDPFDEEGTQYCVLADGSAIYRRTGGGDWASFLSITEINTLTSLSGTGIVDIDLDPTVEGRIWVFWGDLTIITGWYRALRSDDGGANWVDAGEIRSGWGRTPYKILGRGDNVWASYRAGIAASGYVAYTANCGATWADVNTGGYSHYLYWTENEPNSVYSGRNSGQNLCRVTNAGVLTNLDAGNPWGMWFDPDDADHMRLVYGFSESGALHVTNDGWATHSTEGDTTPEVKGPLASWTGQAADEIIVGLTSLFNAHAIGTMSGETDTTPVGRAGANVSSSPYTDSIPEDRGSTVAIHVIYEAPSEGPTPPSGSTITPPDKPGEEPSTIITLGGEVLTQAVTMPDYDGDERGVPIQGDRAAWDVVDYAARHARDLKDAAPVHHVPEGDAAGDAPVWDGEQWVSTGVATQAELDSHEGEANPHGTELGDLADVDVATDPPEDGEGLVWDEAGGEWVPADVTTLADHDHSGDAGDGGTFDAANLTSGAATDGQVLTADGAGNAAWEDATGGGG
ncbi:MAG: hypothetical protein GX601_20300, partial [Anaerolineales bacterium]|nr:hypothetical protein [Anaerolineales bacterium]